MIGVVGPTPDATELAETITAETVQVDDAATIAEADPTVTIAVEDAAVSALVRAGLEAPLLPIRTCDALGPIEPTRLPDVLDSGLTAGFSLRPHPVLGAGQEPTARGVFDVMLVTVDPARISEYTVAATAWTDRFRADGVVIATPAGSTGYTRALDGPVLDHGTAGLAVVPVAEFSRRPVHRVAPQDTSLTVTVERDEGAVTLLVDGQAAGPVPPTQPVTVAVVDTIDVVIDAAQ